MIYNEGPTLQQWHARWKARRDERLIVDRQMVMARKASESARKPEEIKEYVMADAPIVDSYPVERAQTGSQDTVCQTVPLRQNILDFAKMYAAAPTHKGEVDEERPETSHGQSAYLP